MHTLQERFHSMYRTSDYFWMAGFITSIVAMLIGVVLFSLIIHRFFCKRKSAAHSPSHQNRMTKVCASLSATLSLACIVLVFITFPACVMYYCGYNFVGNFFYCAVLDTYILSKIAVYTLFIDRIYNEYFKKICVYSPKVMYLLVIMIVIVLITLVILNALCIVNFRVEFVDFISKISVIVFMTCDVIFSMVTMFLFIKPIYKQQSNQQNPNHYYLHHQIVKYSLLCGTAIVSSLVFELSYLLRVVFGWYHNEFYKDNVVSYLEVSSILQLVDCVVSMFCVYFGFVNKLVFDKYCSCCLRCCRGIHWNIIERRKTAEQINFGDRKPTDLDLYKQPFLDMDESDNVITFNGAHRDSERSVQTTPTFLTQESH